MNRTSKLETYLLQQQSPTRNCKAELLSPFLCTFAGNSMTVPPLPAFHFSSQQNYFPGAQSVRAKLPRTSYEENGMVAPNSESKWPARLVLMTPNMINIDCRVVH